MARLDKLMPVMRNAMLMLANGMTPREADADRVFTNYSQATLDEGKKSFCRARLGQTQRRAQYSD